MAYVGTTLSGAPRRYRRVDSSIFYANQGEEAFLLAGILSRLKMTSVIDCPRHFAL